MTLLRLIIKTLRLAISRVGAGWMFALLTFNFNRVAIADLGAIAVIVTSLIGLHHFISFFYVYWGRLSDRNLIFGLRRTPYILLSGLGASLVFLFLPSIAVGLGERSLAATLEAFLLIGLFGAFMAMNGSSSNALIAEVTTEKERGTVVAVVWAAVIISGIVSAAVSRSIMPTYSPEAMQQLYNLTPAVVLVTILIGIVGMERRVSREEHQALLASQPEERASPLGTFRVASSLMRTNPQVRGFFFFVLLAIMGIFLQDAILEPFGAQVFGMTQAETARFQQSWGAGALLGMLGIGIISSIFPIAKKTIATLGGLGVACGLMMVAGSALSLQPGLINPGLLLLGLGIGFFNVGALSMMMEMTIEGQAGLYMGIWGMAQGFGNGLANVLSGGMLTLLVERGLTTPTVGYSLIFGFEALLMIVAIGILRGISVQEFKGLSRRDISTVLAMDTAGQVLGAWGPPPRSRPQRRPMALAIRLETITSVFVAPRAHPPAAADQIGRALAGLVRPAAPGLELGRGTGRIAIPRVAIGGIVTAIDVAPGLLRIAAERADAAGDVVKLARADARALAVAEGTGRLLF